MVWSWVWVLTGADLRCTDYVQWGIGLTPKRLSSRSNPQHWVGALQPWTGPGLLESKLQAITTKSDASCGTFRSFPFFFKERKRTQHSFLKNGKECKERNVLLQRTEKNAKNATFFCKECKRMQRTQCSSAKELENVSFFCKRIQTL